MALIWPTIMRDAIDWIWKVIDIGNYNFVQLTEVLSVNYLDRFLIVYELHKGEAWTMHLFALACLFQASNMEETYMSLLYMKVVAVTLDAPSMLAISRSVDVILSTTKGTNDSRKETNLHGIDRIPPRMRR
ncbi:cyclin-D3-1 isoform X4 [Lolium perenne]|nr:cyclin-D3-1-like isoform X4 [Lolium perenne]